MIPAICSSVTDLRSRAISNTRPKTDDRVVVDVELKVGKKRTETSSANSLGSCHLALPGANRTLALVVGDIKLTQAGFR